MAEPQKKGIVFKRQSGNLAMDIHKETLIDYLSSLPCKPGGWLRFTLLENNHSEPDRPSHRIQFDPNRPISHRNYQTKD